MNKPFSPSADRNKDPILVELRRELSADQTVLEIGSGTGQHACFFASNLPDIFWQPTELKQNIPAIEHWMRDHDLTNILDPIALDVDLLPWPIISAHACFTCNTFHIVSIESVRSIFSGCKTVLENGGKLCVYGPFSIDGKHTSLGNEQFDKELQASNPRSGIRELSELDRLAQQYGFVACRYTSMPANNLFVVWERALKT